MKYSAQKDELLDFLLYRFGELLQVVARYQSISVSKEDTLAVEYYAFGFSMNDYTRLFLQPTKSPNVVIANKEVNINTFARDFA